MPGSFLAPFTKLVATRIAGVKFVSDPVVFGGELMLSLCYRSNIQNLTLEEAMSLDALHV